MSDGAQSKYYFAVTLFMLLWTNLSSCSGSEPRCASGGLGHASSSDFQLPGAGSEAALCIQRWLLQSQVLCVGCLQCPWRYRQELRGGGGYSRCQEVKGMVFASQFLPDPSGLMGSVSVLPSHSTLSHLLSYMA